jgi:hypothetical protein
MARLPTLRSNISAKAIGDILVGYLTTAPAPYRSSEAIRSYNQIINQNTAPYGMLELISNSSSNFQVPNPSTLTWGSGVYGSQVFTFNASTAWQYLDASGSANLYVSGLTGNVTLDDSFVGTFFDIYGGNGTLTITRTSLAAGAYYTQFRFQYADGFTTRYAYFGARATA